MQEVQASLGRGRRKIARSLVCLVAAGVALGLAVWLGAYLVLRTVNQKPAATILVSSAYERKAVECRGTNLNGMSCRNRTTSGDVLCYRHRRQAQPATAIVNLTPK